MLTDNQCKNAKCPADKRVHKLADAFGMYLEVSPNGGKWWRLKYRHNGKEKRISLGTYPITSLSAARFARDAAKVLLRAGTDPSADRQQSKQKVGATQLTFKTAALEWFEHKANEWSASHSKRTLEQLNRDLVPVFGHRQIADVTKMDILAALKIIEARGSIETAWRGLGAGQDNSATL